MATGTGESSDVRKRQLSLLDMFRKRRKSDDLTDSVPVDMDHSAETSVHSDLVTGTADGVKFHDAAATGQATLLDIGLYVNKHDIPDDIKYQLLKQPWKPDATYKFPKIQQSGQNRSFVYNWLNTFPWLAYSKAKEGAFCVYCVLFATPTVGKGSHQSTGVLVSRPLCKYKDALEEFREHCKDDSYHTKQVHVAVRNFIACYEKPATIVVNQCQVGREKQVTENRDRIRPVIKTVLFCGRQGLALRGTDDYGCLTKEEPPVNDGNFWALLRFRIDAGDQNLESHLQNAPKNATYISPRIQNEIISACATLHMQQIVNEVRQANFFTVLADETCDISKKDQFSIVLRFVKEGSLYERFLTFVEVTDRTGAGLAKTLIDTIHTAGIDVKKCADKAMTAVIQ